MAATIWLACECWKCAKKALIVRDGETAVNTAAETAVEHGAKNHVYVGNKKVYTYHPDGREERIVTLT